MKNFLAFYIIEPLILIKGFLFFKSLQIKNPVQIHKFVVRNFGTIRNS